MSEIPLPPAKPMWTRCPGCKDRVYNEKLDIGIHRGHCPADLQRSIQDLGRRLEELKTKVGGLNDQVTAEPALDPEAVAPWQDDDADEQQADDVTGGDPFVQQQPERDEWDDDENSLASTPAGPIPIR